MTSQFLTSVLLPITTDNHLETLRSYLAKQPLLKELNDNSPNLKIFNQDLETVTIGLVREIIKESTFARYSNQVRALVILAVDQATLPAQNSLLKLLEEPPAKTQMILTATQPNLLLSTIRSRCQIWINPDQKTQAKSEFPPELKNIATQLTTQNLTQAIEIAGQYKDRDEAIKLVNDLTRYFHHLNSTKPNHQNLKIIKYLTQTLKYLRANCNVRLALEEGFFHLTP